jgi:tetratricopeptide (TPR) repeat protein
LNIDFQDHELIFFLAEVGMRFLILMFLFFFRSFSNCSMSCYNLRPGPKRWDCTRRCAERGDKLSQHNVGRYSLTGQFGFKQDYDAAFEWFTKASEQGFARSQVQLASMYEKGVAVSEDKAKALYWYKKAAQQNDVSSQLLVGLWYYKGIGVQKDLVKAYMWTLIAESSGSSKAAKNKDYLKGQLSFKQQLEAQKLFFKFRRKYPKTVDSFTGKPDSVTEQIEGYKSKAREAYKKGDIQKVKAMYLKCAKLGDATCVNDYGYHCAESSSDLDKALKITHKLQKKTPNDACIHDTIGWLYFKKKSYVKALKYLKIAEEMAPNVPEVKEHISIVEKAIKNR